MPGAPVVQEPCSPSIMNNKAELAGVVEDAVKKALMPALAVNHQLYSELSSMNVQLRGKVTLALAFG